MRRFVGTFDTFDFLSFSTTIFFGENDIMVGTASAALQTIAAETSLNECIIKKFPPDGSDVLKDRNYTREENPKPSIDPLNNFDLIANAEKNPNAVVVEVSSDKQKIEEQSSDKVKTITTEGDIPHEISPSERSTEAHILHSKSDTTVRESGELGVMQDLLIKPEKIDSPSQKIDAHAESSEGKQQEEEQGRAAIQIHHKSASERYKELIIQNFEKEQKSIIDESLRIMHLYSQSTKWNFVFNSWPVSRTSNPELLLLYETENISPRGLAKFTGSGPRNILWGETLADFFRVVNLPGETMRLPGRELFPSSMLYNWLRGQESDVLPFTRRLMCLAEKEEPPRVVPVYNIEQLIRNNEAWIREQEDVSWTRLAMPIEKGKKRNPWELPELWPPESIFNASAYPSPWPFEPFKKQWWHPEEKFGSFVHTPNLQQYIPQHLLPETFVVHDPYEVLGGDYVHRDEAPWTEKDDIVRIYKLEKDRCPQPREAEDVRDYSEEISRIKSEREAFLAEPHSRTKMPEGMLYQPATFAAQKPGPCKPPVYVVFPPKPPQPTTKVAHLYLSTTARLGSGHHSHVYQAEFEVPRSFLVAEEICSKCVLQDEKNILEEEDGLNGERRDARWDELSGRYRIKVRGKPARTAMLGDEEYELRPDNRTVDVVYEGPFRAIETRVGYQNLERAPYCEHFSKDHIHPLTTKARVAAKISKRYDDHLSYEADNYRAFPKDFFEHYSGFHLVYPLLQPTPVGAIVPQFYGYYVLDREDERNKEVKYSYLSPILLVEDCGSPIDPEDLSKDDIRECVSLFYRMHSFKYYHGSPYSRNIVRQPGPLEEHPLVRQGNAENTVEGTSRVGSKWSYRLIDFGRTRHKTQTSSGDYTGTKDWEISRMNDWLRGGGLT